MCVCPAVMCVSRSVKLLNVLHFSCSVCRDLTTPKLKTSDFGVISPLRASGAMYARVPTILSVTMVVEVRLDEALVNPKSEIFATKFSSKRMFALKKSSFVRLCLSSLRIVYSTTYVSCWFYTVSLFVALNVNKLLLTSPLSVGGLCVSC